MQIKKEIVHKYLIINILCKKKKKKAIKKAEKTIYLPS